MPKRGQWRGQNINGQDDKMPKREVRRGDKI